jgi:predicted DNA-binding protein YlxM (UPF0122 family)
MSKLVKPSEYAKETGLSRQAIYAQIKSNSINAKKVNGRLYVVVQEDEKPSTTQDDDMQRLKELIASKNETIKVLHNAIDDLKHSNEGVIKTLQSEIELLKQAFAEMRGVYKEAIAYKPQKQEYIGLKKYCKNNGIKLTKEFTKQVKKMYKNGDKRIKKEKDKFYVTGNLND